MTFPKMQPKVLFAEYAIFLAVVLVASAFCLEAFAFSQTKYGTFNGRDWSTKLNVGTFSVSGSMGYNGTNTDYVWITCQAVSKDGTIGADSDYGRRSATINCVPGGRVKEATVSYYINGTRVSFYWDVTP